jgi:hypothetical protein
VDNRVNRWHIHWNFACKHSHRKGQDDCHLCHAKAKDGKSEIVLAVPLLKVDEPVTFNRNGSGGYTHPKGVSVKDAYELLKQKEADLARVRHEIKSLRVVASLLSDDLGSDEMTKKRSSAEKTLDGDPNSEATGTDGLFSSIPVSRPSFWKALRRRK